MTDSRNNKQPPRSALKSAASAGEATPLFPHAAEAQPLVARTPLRKAPAWQFWRTLSTTHRFFLLLLMSGIPFGGHFVKVRRLCALYDA